MGAKEIIGENFGKIIDNRDLNKMSKAIVDYTNGSLIFNYDEILSSVIKLRLCTITRNNIYRFYYQTSLKELKEKPMMWWSSITGSRKKFLL